MLLTYFTEQAMSAYPSEEGLKHGYTVLNFSNRHFDPKEGSRLYNEYLHQYRLAEAVGYDAIMLNEHHNAPFCMQARVGVFASILAAMTERVKIVTLGIPLPLSDNPVALAEEFGMIDMISKGRLVSGIVRGGGTEQLAHNANPAYNRERFEEAHDLIIKTWTQPGPFRWEGDHYQFRVVNPWVRPLQTPHPRIFVPGVSSNETIEWAAARRYPYIGLGTDTRTQKRIMDIYEQTAAKHGYTPGPENYGQLLRVHVQDTDEKAEEMARHFTWMQGEFTGLAHPVWSAPSGYLAAGRRTRVVEQVNSRLKGTTKFNERQAGQRNAEASFKAQVENMQIIHGSPKTALEKLKTVLRQTRPGVFCMWSIDGAMPFEAGNRCIELIGREILPALRAFAKEEGINSPFEAGAPVSLDHAAAERQAAAG